MWSQSDDCGLVTNNVVSVAANVVLSDRIVALNVVSKTG